MPDSSPLPFEIGDAVRVKEGASHADVPTWDIGGWQGRIVDIHYSDPAMLVVEWDSVTLAEMPDASIDAAEEKGLDWERCVLSPDDVEEAAPRDAPEDVERERRRIREKHFWRRIGEGGTYIHQILEKTPSLSRQTIFQTWETELQHRLSFPIDATVSASHRGSPPHSGDEVQILGIHLLDCHYGLLATVRFGSETAQIPLVNLEPKEETSSEYRPLRAYRIWFANR
jgi:hypothetical protein